MKIYLKFVMILCFSVLSAQNKEPDPAYQKKIAKEASDINVNQEKLTPKVLKKFSNKKSSDSVSTEEAITKINVVGEINAILNYKVNRIWREDLYCLVCEKDLEQGKIA